MTLGQLLLLVLILVVVWLGTRLKRHEHRLERLEGENKTEPSED